MAKMEQQQEQPQHFHMALAQPKTHYSVLIVGGGIAGLTLGVACRKLGIDFLILERKPEIEPLGAGLTLSPNSSRLMDQLGIYDGVRNRGSMLRKQLVYYNTKYWRSIHFGNLPKKYGYGFANIERCLLQEIIYELVGDENVRWSTSVSDIIDEPDNPHVQVKLADGQQLTADVVVGADGVRSLTRRLMAVKNGLPGANTIEFTGRRHLVGCTSPVPYFTEKERAIGCWIFYDDGIFTSWPCKDHKISFGSVKVYPKDQAASLNAVWDDISVQNTFAHLNHRFHPLGKNKSVKDFTDLCDRAVATDNYQEIGFPSMSFGRVVLIGDAGHAMSPFAGQGANQALEDAGILANYLSPLFKHGAVKNDYHSVADSLRAFSKKREKRVQTMVKFSDLWARVHNATLPYGTGKIVREIVYRWLPDEVWFRILRFIYEEQPTIDGLPDNGPVQPPNTEWTFTTIFTLMFLSIFLAILALTGHLTDFVIPYAVSIAWASYGLAHQYAGPVGDILKDKALSMQDSLYESISPLQNLLREWAGFSAGVGAALLWTRGPLRHKA